MARAFLFVLDSVGIGGAPDAADFGDAGADTLGHIAAACAGGGGDAGRIPGGALRIPNLARLGISGAAELATGKPLAGVPVADPAEALFAAASEVSSGKDTPSGHWEIAGLPVPFDWGYFPKEGPAFPDWLCEALATAARSDAILGNCHASGTEIIRRHGAEHIRTGRPICYTSADSVLQIAAHETHFGLDRLLDLCRHARRLVDPLRIGRVIARPFVGETPDDFTRTANRRDFAVPPTGPTLLDRVEAAGGRVIAVGKISDIFAGRGITETRKAAGNMALFDAALEACRLASDGDLVFANFVDFDSDHGHRRDVAGYAAALEAFDTRLPEILEALGPGDLLVLTADHGCDPTWQGSDHTRERVPVLATGPGIGTGPVGVLDSYADIGASVADHLGLPPGPHGRSFLAWGRDA